MVDTSKDAVIRSAMCDVGTIGRELILTLLNERDEARAEIEQLTKAHDTVCGALAEAISRAEKAEAESQRLRGALKPFTNAVDAAHTALRALKGG